MRYDLGDLQILAVLEAVVGFPADTVTSPEKSSAGGSLRSYSSPLLD